MKKVTLRADKQIVFVAGAVSVCCALVLLTPWFLQKFSARQQAGAKAAYATLARALETGDAARINQQTDQQSRASLREVAAQMGGQQKLGKWMRTVGQVEPVMHMIFTVDVIASDRQNIVYFQFSQRNGRWLLVVAFVDHAPQNERHAL